MRNITMFDNLDAAVVAAVAVIWVMSRQWQLVWAVVALALYHLWGRWIVWNSADPALELAALATGIGWAFVFGPILSVYGRLIGSVFFTMAVVTALWSPFGIPLVGKGVGFNLWNFLSLCLYAASALTIMGVLSHARLSTARRARRD
ncbi:hypothetical protein ACLB6G_20240 [Zhengella sp. ZM62]|uniref:hypothetical protein n=1 Tax=Zhengella sedimenti TaxID=3390035 RepID=UPI003975142E